MLKLTSILMQVAFCRSLFNFMGDPRIDIETKGWDIEANGWDLQIDTDVAEQYPTLATFEDCKKFLKDSNATFQNNESPSETADFQNNESPSETTDFNLDASYGMYTNRINIVNIVYNTRGYFPFFPTINKAAASSNVPVLTSCCPE